MFSLPAGQPQPKGSERRAERADYQPEHPGSKEPDVCFLLRLPGSRDQLSVSHRGTSENHRDRNALPSASVASLFNRDFPLCLQLMEAVHKQEEINYRLQDYIDKIIVAIMECNPSILEVK